MPDRLQSLDLSHLSWAVVCRVAFDYVHKHSFETVRVIRLARNMGKVWPTSPLLFVSKIPVTAQTCLTIGVAGGGGRGVLELWKACGEHHNVAAEASVPASCSRGSSASGTLNSSGHYFVAWTASKTTKEYFCQETQKVVCVTHL